MLITVIAALLFASESRASGNYYDDGTGTDVLSSVFENSGVATSCSGCHATSNAACTSDGVTATSYLGYSGVTSCYTRIQQKLTASPGAGVRMPQGGPYTNNATYTTALNTWNGLGRPLAPPTVTTTTATGISKTVATLRGTFNYNVYSGTSVQGTYRFRYNTSASTVGSTLTTAVNDTGTANESDQTMISGLTCGTSYFYRAQVTNGGGSANGSWVGFSTTACSPPIIAEGASTAVLMSEDGSPMAFNLTLNSSVGETGTLQWSITTPASNGVATASGTGTSKSIGYTPTLNYTGMDSFVVQVENLTTNLTDSIVVNVTISAVDDPPTIDENPGPVAVVMDEDGSPTAFSLTLNATDTDTAGGSLTWSISSAASDGVASASGSGNSKAIGYTPTADFNGMDSFIVQVTDGGSSDTITVNVTVNARNDAPIITPVGAQAGTEGVLLTITPVVTDPDDLNDGSGALTWSITSGGQPGMVISNQGVITWTPPLGTPPPPATFNQMYPITIRVADDGAHGAAPDTDSFVITVNPPDGDSDMVADYNDYCPAQADASNADADGDGTRGSDADPNDNVGGDICDIDDDNDGMPDSFELANSFDPFDPSDAAEDADNDGVTNLQEYLDGTNPNQKNLVINATGYLTPYTLKPPNPASIHSLATAVTANDYGPYRPGDNTITWTPSNANDTDLATNDPGNLVSDPPEQPFFIRPLVNLGPNQQAEEGAAVMVTVTLNGDSPSWPATPATVTYKVSGTAGAADHNAANGTLTFNDGEYIKTINFNTTADAKQDPDETVVFTLTTATNAALGSNRTHKVTIVEDNVAPQVELQFTQGAIVVGSTYAGDGAITIDALVSDVNSTQGHNYDWSNTDNALVPPGNVASWSPVAPMAGNYLIDVTVTDTGNPKPSKSTRMTRILRVNSGMAAALGGGDSDLDGIPDNDAAEGYADDDGDGIPNYLDAIDGLVAGANLVPDQTQNASTSMLLQTESGLRLVRGSTAQAANRFGALLTDTEIRRFGSMNGDKPANPGDNQDHVGGIYDFEIRGLVPGASASIVIPLQSAIPKNAEYRKFHPASGWTVFAEDNNNRLASASADDGACPEPGSNVFQDGLNYLDNCLELTIQDGGPNDTDSRRNGVVSDPGTIGTRLSDPQEEEVKDGGGRLSPLLLITLLTLGGFAWWRRRRGVPARLR